MDEEEEFDALQDGLEMILSTLLESRKRIEEVGASETGALLNLWSVLRFARSVMGETAYSLAMKQGGDGDGLGLLAHRLQVIAPFMEGDWPADFTYGAVVEEVYAVAGGDVPYIFAQRDKVQGKRRNAFRLAVCKLNALVWYEALQRRGLSAGKSQSLIAGAFNSSWPAIQKWKAECIERLSQREYDQAMIRGNQIDIHPINGKLSDEEVAAAINKAGSDYLAELLREKNAVSVPSSETH